MVLEPNMSLADTPPTLDKAQMSNREPSDNLAWFLFGVGGFGLTSKVPKPLAFGSKTWGIWHMFHYFGLGGLVAGGAILGSKQGP